MVGSSHEALHWVFQKDPALLTRAFQSVLHIPFPGRRGAGEKRRGQARELGVLPVVPVCEVSL